MVRLHLEPTTGAPGWQQYSAEVRQFTRTRADLRGRGSTVACTGLTEKARQVSFAYRLGAIRRDWQRTATLTAWRSMPKAIVVATATTMAPGEVSGSRPPHVETVAQAALALRLTHSGTAWA